MKILMALLAVLMAFFSQKLIKISRINAYVTEAQEAYSRQDFSTAIYFYKYLSDSLQVRDRAVRLNLAHAYYQQKKMGQAVKYYQPLLTKTPTRIASLVNLQLGVIIVSKDKTKALNYFKQALILNPLNEEARFNYEWLKKYLAANPEENDAQLPPPQPDQAKRDRAEQKKETTQSGKKEDNAGSTQQEMPDPTTKDAQNPPSSNTDDNIPGSEETESNAPVPNASSNKQREEKSGLLPGTTRGLNNEAGSASDKAGISGKGSREASNEGDQNSQTTYERLKEANLTPEKAKMLLNAMREAEVQYLQQIPRKNTRKSNSGKPDW
ncbi:hypothetical protein AHMF7605_02155 [Adhaeribacter arboris]|uniref:Uncharacterized protein n=1 Tax=Adhaeribacter arboris TaxID=2072846 RepID=A0A2T2YA56_9BACT|nr:hypothetical protein [Adhaeribacter arboris]PSR52411.1 hypothetical protein AHMF7605_02155 [Adhaeribacter arboris]